MATLNPKLAFKPPHDHDHHHKHFSLAKQLATHTGHRSAPHTQLQVIGSGRTTKLDEKAHSVSHRSHADNSVTPNPCEYTAKVDKSPEPQFWDIKLVKSSCRTLARTHVLT